MKARCPACGVTFGGGDGSGGHCRACCTTFRTQSAFDRHRVGKHGPERRCLTADEMTAAGWRDTDRGWTPYRSYAPDWLPR